MSEYRGEGGRLAQQIGETLASVRILIEQSRETKEDIRRQEERVASEMRGVKDEQNRTNASITQRLETIGSQMRTLEDQTRTITVEVTGMRSTIREMKEPVDKLIDLRNRIFAWVAVLSAVTATIWILVGPVIRGMLSSAFPGLK